MPTLLRPKAGEVLGASAGAGLALPNLHFSLGFGQGETRVSVSLLSASVLRGPWLLAMSLGEPKPFSCRFAGALELPVLQGLLCLRVLLPGRGVAVP